MADETRRRGGHSSLLQSHTLLSGYCKGEPVYNDVAEMWTEDTRVLRAQAEMLEYAAVRADEPNFIDRSTLGSIGITIGATES